MLVRSLPLVLSVTTLLIDFDHHHGNGVMATTHKSTATKPISNKISSKPFIPGNKHAPNFMNEDDEPSAVQEESEPDHDTRNFMSKQSSKDHGKSPKSQRDKYTKFDIEEESVLGVDPSEFFSEDLKPQPLSKTNNEIAVEEEEEDDDNLEEDDDDVEDDVEEDDDVEDDDVEEGEDVEGDVDDDDDDDGVEGEDDDEGDDDKDDDDDVEEDDDDVEGEDDDDDVEGDDDDDVEGGEENDVEGGDDDDGVEEEEKAHKVKTFKKSKSKKQKSPSATIEPWSDNEIIDKESTDYYSTTKGDEKEVNESTVHSSKAREDVGESTLQKLSLDAKKAVKGIRKDLCSVVDSTNTLINLINKRGDQSDISQISICEKVDAGESAEEEASEIKANEEGEGEEEGEEEEEEVKEEVKEKEKEENKDDTEEEGSKDKENDDESKEIQNTTYSSKASQQRLRKKTTGLAHGPASFKSSKDTTPRNLAVKPTPVVLTVEENKPPAYLPTFTINKDCNKMQQAILFDDAPGLNLLLIKGQKDPLDLACVKTLIATATDNRRELTIKVLADRIIPFLKETQLEETRNYFMSPDAHPQMMDAYLDHYKRASFDTKRNMLTTAMKSMNEAQFLQSLSFWITKNPKMIDKEGFTERQKELERLYVSILMHQKLTERPELPSNTASAIITATQLMSRDERKKQPRSTLKYLLSSTMNMTQILLNGHSNILDLWYIFDQTAADTFLKEHGTKLMAIPRLPVSSLLSISMKLDRETLMNQVEDLKDDILQESYFALIVEKRLRGIKPYTEPCKEDDTVDLASIIKEEEYRTLSTTIQSTILAHIVHRYFGIHPDLQVKTQALYPTFTDVNSIVAQYCEHTPKLVITNSSAMLASKEEDEELD